MCTECIDNYLSRLFCKDVNRCAMTFGPTIWCALSTKTLKTTSIGVTCHHCPCAKSVARIKIRTFLQTKDMHKFKSSFFILCCDSAEIMTEHKTTRVRFGKDHDDHSTENTCFGHHQCLVVLSKRPSFDATNMPKLPLKSICIFVVETRQEMPIVPIGIASNFTLSNYETLQSLIKMYPSVAHLRILMHSLNLWSLDWQPSSLFLENLFCFQKICCILFVQLHHPLFTLSS